MAEGKFVISAQNKIKDGLDAAKKDLLGFEDAAKKVGDTLKSALTVTAIAVGLKKLGEAAFDCFKEFGEGERRLNTLKIALNNNAISVQNATSLIEKMARQSLASKDDIEGLVAELAALGKSDAEIESITTAAVNLANVTGKDLNSAFTLINATYAGTTGRLTQLLPEIKNLSTEQLAAGEATRLINEKFGALSTQLAENDIPQKLKNIADGWGDLKETLGAQVAPLFNPLLEGINSIITAWNSASRAAEAHRQLLSASGWTQKIALNQEIIDANRPRLNDLQAKQTAYGKSVGWNETMLRQSPQYQAWQAEINDLIAENIKAQKAIDYYTEQLKKTPVSLLNPVDQVALLRDGNARSGGAPAFDYNTTAMATDDFLLFQNSIHEQQAAVGWTPSLAVQEALASNLAPPKTFLEELSSAYAGNIDTIGSITGQFVNQLTGATTDVAAYSDSLSDAMAGAIDAGFIQPVSEVAKELGGNLLQYEESFYLNFRPDTFTEELSKAYAGNVDVIGATTGQFVGQLTGATTDVETYSDALSNAMSGAADAIDGIVPRVVDSLNSLNTNLLLFEESFLVNYDPRNTAEILGDIYAAGGVDMVGGNMGTSAGVTGSAETVALPGPSFATMLARVVGDAGAGLTSAFDTIAAGMGDFGIAMLGPISELMAALGPFANMIAGMTPLLAVLLPVVESFVSVIAPVMQSVLAPLMDALTRLGVMLGQMLLPIFDALAPVILMIAQILQTLFIPIMQFLSPIMQAFAIMLQPLGPAMGALAKAVVILMSPVQWLADLFMWVGEVLKTFAWNIAHPFRQESGPGAFSSDAFSGLNDRLKAIDALGTNNQTFQNSAISPSASVASQSASYRTQQITINIYQQAPVVGSGGMDEFVNTIRTKFGELAYFGATA